MRDTDFTQGLRHAEYTLLVAAVILIAAGAAGDLWWLIGVGAWALIAGGAIEMIFRP
ncbi:MULTISPECIES: hypothetical protein [unclassified Streptomyces]|uniref:hypothetical protein n=1 Tax=unclassified Streptomyces TaxID=2593676 RepID=UPI0033CFECB8